VAGAVDPGVTVDVDAQVGAVGGFEVQFLLALKEVDHALLLGLDLAPMGDGIGLVEVAGLEDEVGVLPQRHLGVLRRGERGIERAAPVQFFRVALRLARTFHEHLEDRLAGGRRHALPFRIDARERFGVGLGPERDGDIDLFDLVERDGVHVLELLLAGVLVEELDDGLGRALDVGERADAHALLVERFEQRDGDGLAGEADELAGFYAGGILDDDAGQLIEAVVAQGEPLRGIV